MTRAWIPLIAALALVAPPGGVAAQPATPTWPDLSQPAGVEGGGEQDAAVVVGIEDYVVVSDVPGARANANDWYTWLVDTRKVPVGSVVLLRDSEATREGILDAAQRARERAQAGGTLWFVFIGHGAPGKDGTDGLLVGWDTQQTANSLYARGLPQSDLLAELEQGPQASTLLVLDACFSGRTGTGDVIVSGLQPLIPDYSVKPRNATVVTAGRADQFAGPLPGAARPAFSYLLLGALRGWGDADGDQQVSTREAVDYSVSALYALVRDRTQTPELHGPGAANVLSKGQEQGPNLRELVVQLGPGETKPPAPGGDKPSSGGLMDELEALRKRQQQREGDLATETARVQGEATRAWAVTEEIARGGGAEGELALRKFLEAYDGCTVTVGGQTHPVTIAEVPQAKDWLARLERGEATPPGGDAAADEPPTPPPDPQPTDQPGHDLTTPQGMLDFMGDMVENAEGDGSYGFEDGYADDGYDDLKGFESLDGQAPTTSPDATAYLQTVMGLMATGVPSLREFADLATFYGSSAAEQERLLYVAAEEAALAELKALPGYAGDTGLRDAAIQTMEYGLSLTQGPCAEIVSLVRGAEHKGEMSDLVLQSIEARLQQVEADSVWYNDMLLLAIDSFAMLYGPDLDAVFQPM